MRNQLIVEALKVMGPKNIVLASLKSKSKKLSSSYFKRHKLMRLMQRKLMSIS